MDILAGGVEEIPPELHEPLRVARMRMSGPLFSFDNFFILASH